MKKETYMAEKTPKGSLIVRPDVWVNMGGCQNYGPFLGTPNIKCRTILGTQKGTIILTTTHVYAFTHSRFLVST